MLECMCLNVCAACSLETDTTQDDSYATFRASGLVGVPTNHMYDDNNTSYDEGQMTMMLTYVIPSKRVLEALKPEL